MTKRLPLAVLAVLLLAPAAGAQVFHDLPGVVTTEEHEAQDPVVCEPRYIEPPENSTQQHWGRTVYNCTRGEVKSTSNSMPLSRERDLRGYDW